MMVERMKFWGAFNRATAIVTEKSRGECNCFEKYAISKVAPVLGDIYTPEDYISLPDEMRELICNILHDSGFRQEAGMLRAVDFGQTLSLKEG